MNFPPVEHCLDFLHLVSYRIRTVELFHCFFPNQCAEALLKEPEYSFDSTDPLPSCDEGYHTTFLEAEFLKCVHTNLFPLMPDYVCTPPEYFDFPDIIPYEPWPPDADTFSVQFTRWLLFHHSSPRVRSFLAENPSIRPVLAHAFCPSLLLLYSNSNALPHPDLPLLFNSVAQRTGNPFLDFPDSTDHIQPFPWEMNVISQLIAYRSQAEVIHSCLLSLDADFGLDPSRWRKAVDFWNLIASDY